MRFYILFLIFFIEIKIVYAFEIKDSIPKGVIIDSVKCKANPQYSYALYLPEAYTESKPCPVVFVFDPGANGKIEAVLFQEAAKKYEYALVCSNNSRNGIWEENVKSVNITMDDALDRFNFDKNRIYTAGFSGGSRVASWVALKTQKIAGVIGYGAGFPSFSAFNQSQIKGFDYIGLIGKKDFNYFEMLELEKLLEKSGIQVRIIISDLNHQLPSKLSILEAVECLELNAIKRGLCPKNSEFIQSIFKNRFDSISKLEKNGKIFEFVSNLKYLINDFCGLYDVSIYDKKYDSLLKTKDYANHLEEMDKIFKTEKNETGKYYESALSIKQNLNFTDSAYYWWLSEISLYEKQAKKDNCLNQELAARLMGYIYMIQYQLGNEFYEFKKYPQAIKCFKLCIEAMPANKYAHYQLACAQAYNKNYSASSKTLEILIKLGFRNKKALEKEPAFTNMRGNKRFNLILMQID